jgi:uncharacterized membrane protein
MILLVVLLIVTGLARLAGQLGVRALRLVPRTRRLAAVALIVFLVAVLPANIHAAQAGVILRGAPPTPLVPRVALQLFFIALLWWSGVRAPRAPEGSELAAPGAG